MIFWALSESWDLTPKRKTSKLGFYRKQLYASERISQSSTPSSSSTHKLITLTSHAVLTKMAQTLAMPLAPSLSVICNGRNPNPLSNSLSFPLRNPNKVNFTSTPHFKFWVELKNSWVSSILHRLVASASNACVLAESKFQTTKGSSSLFSTFMELGVPERAQS